jgi:hypothetical protein
MRREDSDAITRDPQRIVTIVTYDRTVTAMRLIPLLPWLLFLDFFIPADDVIAHDAVIDVDVYLYSNRNSKMTGQIFVKLVATLCHWRLLPIHNISF